MANEAERLIAMSMEKITSSRSRHGWINLRHNLLVANVLLKARTVYMMANYETMMKARQVQVREREKPVKVKLADSMSDMVSSPLTTEDTMVTSIINETSVHMDATDSDSVVTEINDHLEPNMRDTDKGNTPPLTNDNNNKMSCCTKRRLTKVDSNQKNTKKVRVEPSSPRRDVRGVHFGCLIKSDEKVTG